MELIIIRHGLPLRVEKEDGSAADPKLSKTGLMQANKLANWMRNEHLDALYCSPMMRARMTAEPLAAVKNMDIQIEPDVAEHDRDASTYVPVEEIKEKEPERWKRLIANGWGLTPEELELFRERVLKGIGKIIAENRGKKAAVVCHGGIIGIWASHVLETKKWVLPIPEYTSINRFMASSSGVLTVKSLNEAAHLTRPPKTDSLLKIEL